MTERRSTLHRKTNETDIKAMISINDNAPSYQEPYHEQSCRIHTGLGFFDHMLDQLAKHAGFNLQLDVNGDLYCDECI